MHRTMARRLTLITVILLIIIIFKVSGLGQYLTLDYLKQSQERFTGLYRDHQAAVLGGYFLIYVLVTALSLPGAAAMSLAGGALFGFWTGLLVVSFASSIGATLACLAARFLLHDWVQNRFGNRLAPVNTGIEKEGSFYLFSLRLVPIFPFFVINLVMGLTNMRLFTFYWVSQLGMLPGTMVYVNAGKELGQVESAAGLFSPGLIISFMILGLFPLTVKKSLDYYRRRRGRQPLSSEEFLDS